MRCFFKAVIVCCVVLFCKIAEADKTAATANSAEMALAKKLLNMAPRIALDEKNVSSFEVYGCFDMGGLKLRFVIIGKKPDRTSLLVLDDRDKTPVLAGTGKAFMIYDPIDSNILTGDGRACFMLDSEDSVDDSGIPGKNLELGFGVYSGGAEDTTNSAEKVSDENTTVINIGAFMKMLTTNLTVTANGSAYILRGTTPRGNRAVCYIDPASKTGPYKRVELYMSDSPHPFLTLEKILINEPVADKQLRFPKDKLAETGLRLKKLKSKSMLDIAALMASLMRSLMVRLALNSSDAELMKKIEGMMSGVKLDWEQMRQNDKKAAKSLRGVFRIMDVSVDDL